jgi:hypothetical protein
VSQFNLNIDNSESSVIVRRSLREWDEFCRKVQAATEINPLETKEAQIKRKEFALLNIDNFVKTYFPFYADDGKTDAAYFQLDAAKAINDDPNIFAVLEWPREHAKTVYAGIIIPLNLMVQGKMKFYFHLGRTGDLAEDHIQEIKYLLENAQLFIHDWSDGGFKSFGSWEKDDFITKKGCRFKGIGRGQAPQGTRDKNSRPDYIHLCDVDDYELVENEKRVRGVLDWFFGAVIPASSIKGSRTVVDGNRIHPRSVLANIVGDITANTPKREDLYHSKVFATQIPGQNYTCCFIEDGGVPSWPRYTNEELIRRFKKIGITKTKGEYYHIHIIEGKIFTDKMIQWKPMLPLNEYNVLIGYFDPSFTNSPTSDFKAISVWGLHGRERHCIKRFTQQAPINNAYAWMWNFQKHLPSGVGIIWYMENQFYNEPFVKGLQGFNLANGCNLGIIRDNRDKPNKYVRIVNMEPIYSLGEVYFNIAEIHSADMIEGNNQLKGIEPGYHSPDDAPDADEGNWYYLSQHINGTEFSARTGRTTNRNKRVV